MKNKPSSTAVFVANGVWSVGQHQQFSYLVPDQMKMCNEAIVKSVNSLLNMPMGKKLLCMKTAMMERFSIPGIYLHFVCRKRCIEEYVCTAIDQGAEQVVIIGAGFDVLSLLISKKYPDVRVIEIDHPATQAWKKAIISQVFPDEKIHFIDLDLTKTTLQERLLASPEYSESRKTVFVAEGLTMYLGEKDVYEMLQFVKNHSAQKSPFIFTYMEESQPGQFQFQNATMWTDLWLKLKGERFTWGATEPNLTKLLENAGFVLREHSTTANRREKFLSAHAGVRLALGENIAVVHHFTDV